MVRRTVTDPELAEALSPRGFPIGCKRPVLDSDYFETFNRDNVTLVDLREGGIETITETGIQTAQGHYDLDVIVFATGLRRHDRRAVPHRHPRPRRAAAPRRVGRRAAHLLGLQTVGFPNLFTCTGPGSPSVLANMVVCIEQHVEWIGACLAYLRDHGYTHDRADAGSAGSVGRTRQRGRPRARCSPRPTCNSWYLGANIPGKARVFLPYVGGLPAYIEKAEAIASGGYEGFALELRAREQAHVLS